MGCCISKEDEDGEGGGKDNEMEMKGLNENDPMLSISSDMSSPTIQIEDNNTVRFFYLNMNRFCFVYTHFFVLFLDEKERIQKKVNLKNIFYFSTTISLLFFSLFLSSFFTLYD